MVRPEDYGDKFPSDSGDVDPNQSLENREIDYELRTGDTNKFSSEPGQVLRPDTGAQFIPEDLQDTFRGIIIKKHRRGVFDVSLNDGKLLIELEADRIDEHEDFFPGDTVTIIRVEEENKFVISTKGRERELQLIKVRINPDVEFKTSEEKIIPFDIILEELPSKDDENDNEADDILSQIPRSINLSDPGIFRFDHIEDTDHLYEFSLNLEIESGEEDCLKVSDDCFTCDMDGAPACTKEIIFDRESGFRVCTTTTGATGVYLDFEVIGSILNTDGQGNLIITDSPQLGGNVSVGTQRGQGHLKLGGDIPPYTWLTHGDGQTKIKLPSGNPQTSNDYVVAIAKDGENVDLGYAKPGILTVQTDVIERYVYTDPDNPFYIEYEKVDIITRTDLIPPSPLIRDIEIPALALSFDEPAITSNPCILGECLENFCNVSIVLNGVTNNDPTVPELVLDDSNQPTIHGICGDCADWNREWELFKLLEEGGDSKFALGQVGGNYSEKKPDGTRAKTACFPCGDIGDDTGMVLDVICYSDGEISATLTIKIKSCTLVVVTWLKYNPREFFNKEADSWIYSFTGGNDNKLHCYTPSGVCVTPSEVYDWGNGNPPCQEDELDKFYDLLNCLWDFQTKPILKLYTCDRTDEPPPLPRVCDPCQEQFYPLSTVDFSISSNSIGTPNIASPFTDAVHDNIWALSDVINWDTAQSGSTESTIKLAAGELNDPTGFDIFILSGTGSGQVREAISWDNGTKIAGITPDWTVTPDDTSIYEIRDPNRPEVIKSIWTSPPTISDCQYEIYVRYMYNGFPIGDLAELAVFDQSQSIDLLWDLPDTDATSLDGLHNTDTFEDVKYVFLGSFISFGLNQITFELEGPRNPGDTLIFDHLLIRRFIS